MANLTTKYLGLTLKSPIIVSSSGLTKSVENIIQAEANGAGAVVLKSLFEEQIRFEIHKEFSKTADIMPYPEAEDLIGNYCRNQSIGEYIKLIQDAKKAVKIPVIASINCYTSSEWTAFAKDIQNAGADALELNVFVLPSDFTRTPEQNEDMYFNIVSEVKKHISIPIALKISHYFSSFAQTAQKLSWSGIQGLVLFNRFFAPDMDIEKFTIVPADIYSSAHEMSLSLRWIGIMADNVKCDLAASTGIHDGKAVIKQLLAGAKAVEICSILYKKGFTHIKTMNSEIENWMDKHKYANIDDFRAKLSHKNSENPAAYQRVQFMKHFAGIE